MANYDLKNCPLCGGKAIFALRSTMYPSGGQAVGFGFYIQCSKCDLRLPKGGEMTFSIGENGDLSYLKDDRADMVARWNTRKGEA